MHKGNHIAVVCNYQLKNNRIGSMDRFFIAFNKVCIDKGYIVDWFFPKSKAIELFSDYSTQWLLMFMQGVCAIYGCHWSYPDPYITELFRAVPLHPECGQLPGTTHLCCLFTGSAVDQGQ